MAESSKDVTSEVKETKVTESGDKELDDLLDSALEDLIQQPSAAEITEDETKLETISTTTEEVEGINLSEMNAQWGDEIKNLAANYESTMEQLLGQMMAASQSVGGGEIPNNITLPTQEEINASIQQLAEATTKVLSKTETNSNNADITATIFETLQGLSQGAQNAQQTELNDESFASMFSSLGLDGANASLPGMAGTGGPGDGFIIQDMMQWLISKDVLYPSLKEITDKYPKWLDDNKPTLDEATFEKYTKQNNLMKSVCTELESENGSDSAEVKKERTDRVLNLMLQLEYLGEPPQDLVGAQLGNTMALGAAAQNGGCSLQ